MAVAPIYEDFLPSTELVEEEDCDTLVLALPGFSKEQLRVQLTKGGILRISGTRHIRDNKWIRFLKEFPVSTNTDTNKITAKFEGGTMYVKQPKLIIKENNQDQIMFPPSQNAIEPHAPKKSLEETGQNAISRNEQTKNTEKDQEKVEEKQKIDKTPTDLVNAAEKKNKGTAGNEDGGGKTRLPNYRDISGAMAARLKMPRRVMNAVVVALLAILLGLYVNNWIRSFGKAEN